MKSEYYFLKGEGINIPRIKFANPYRHLTIFNDSPSDVIVTDGNKTIAYIPENASITLHDVFTDDNDKNYFADTVLYFHTTPFPLGTVLIHLINFGGAK